MTTLAATALRQQSADLINRVAYGGDRVLLERHGKPVAAVISVEDLELLQALENRIDIAAARKALKEHGSVSLDDVKKRLGLR